MRRISVFLVCFLLTTLISFGQEKKPDELLSNAIYLEEVKGNLEEAILIYQDIIKKYPEQRAIVAEALFHLGLSNEKLGNKKAKGYYETLVNSFGDQTKFVRIAKERLSQLILLAEKISKAPLVPKFTKIKIASNPQNGVLSPDGNSLAFFSEGAVWIIPIHGNVNPEVAGEPIRIAEIPNAWDFGSLMSWSKDGNWIAVNGDETDEGTDVHIVKVATGELRTISVPQRGGHSWSYRLSLSPNGQILAFSAIELGMQQEDAPHPHDRRIYTVPVQGGEPKQVSSKGARAWLPAFSPDGKFVAYVGYSKNNIGELWIVPTTGGNPMKLAKVNGRLRGPVWSSDGKYIAAHHEPKNTNSSNEILVYALSSDLSTIGEPKKITLPGESYNILAGWTPDNELGVFIQLEEHSAIYTVHASGGKAVQVSSEEQYPYYTRWSPNGKRIYFRGVNVEKQGVNKLYISATGGKSVEVPVRSEKNIYSRIPGGGFNISPDGKKLVISTGTSKLGPNEGNIVIIPLEGDGLPDRISGGKAFNGRYPCWSPDGKWIAFVGWTPKKPDDESFLAIYIIPSEGGKIRQISTEADDVGEGAITFSKGGEQITFFSDSTIKTIPIEGGQNNVLVANIKSSEHSHLAYSPDGLKIAHSTRGKIWITLLDDGIPQELKTGLPKEARQRGFGWSPDSKKIAFVSTIGGSAEFFLVSDFLPLDKLAKKENPKPAKEPEGIRIEQVWSGTEVDISGRVSADGEYLSFVDWDTGDLALRNLNTKQNSSLVPGNWDTPMQYAQYNVISPNGKQIAYQWYNKKAYDLYLINIDNPIPKLLYRKDGVSVYPYCWLSDNEIIINIRKKGTKSQFGSYNILDGTIEILETFNTRNWKLTSSPDENYIAYDFKNETQDGALDINLLSMDAKGEVALVENPANDKVLGWMPKGKEFLFISDRSGTWDLWAIAVDNGKPIGQERRLYTDIGEVEPMGITKNGECYFGFSRRNFTTYIATFNIKTGELLEQEGKPIIGSNFQAKWSPDGQYLAYIKDGNIKSDNPRQLTIQDLKTGAERKIGNSLYLVLDPRWSPDGNSLIVIGTDKSVLSTNAWQGVYQVDVKTGKTAEILLLSDYKYNMPKDASAPLSNIEWSLDGKSIFYLFFKDRLVKHNLKTGEDKILYTDSNFNYGLLDRSPDGKSLLFAIYRPEEKKSYLYSIPVEGGNIKELCTTQEADVFTTASWSPDSKDIYFTERSDATSIWKISAQGGNPKKVWQSENRLEFISIHPDGNQMTFSVRERTTEIRVIKGLIKELEKNSNTSK